MYIYTYIDIYIHYIYIYTYLYIYVNICTQIYIYIALGYSWRRVDPNFAAPPYPTPILWSQSRRGKATNHRP